MDSLSDKLKMLGYEEKIAKTCRVYSKGAKAYLLSEDGEEIIAETAKEDKSYEFATVLQFIRNETMISVGKFNSNLNIRYDGEQYLANNGAYFVVDDNKIRPILFIKTLSYAELYISLIKRSEKGLELKVYLRYSELDKIKEMYLTLPDSSQLWNLDQLYYNLGILTTIDGTPIVILHEHIIDMDSRNITEVSPRKSDRIRQNIGVTYNFYDDIKTRDLYYIENDRAFNFSDGEYYEIHELNEFFCTLKIDKSNFLHSRSTDAEQIENRLLLKR